VSSVGSFFSYRESTSGYAYSAGRFGFRPPFREATPVGANNDLCLIVQMRIVVAGTGGSVQTFGVKRFTGMISSFLFRLSKSVSEPESAYTRVSQTVVRGPQVVLGFCPCGPFRFNISPKKTEKVKLT